MELPKSAQRFRAAAEAAGLKFEIREMPDSTRSAEEAAAACDCALGQIVKSLVFAGKESGSPYLLLVSGSNRVDQNAVATIIGEKLDRPNADFVREVTGYSIGGIPPLGFALPVKTWMDEDLLQYDEIFAAAGTPYCIFSASPNDLAKSAGADIIKVT